MLEAAFRSLDSATASFDVHHVLRYMHAPNDPGSIEFPCRMGQATGLIFDVWRFDTLGGSHFDRTPRANDLLYFIPRLPKLGGHLY